MTVRIFLLPTQYDIIDFRQGNRPENLLVRDFASPAELEAYRDGIDAIVDEGDQVENLVVTGAKVSYTRRLDDPDAVPEAVEKEFPSAAEAEAYGKGVGDAEGCVAPLLVDDTDDRFEELLEWVVPDEVGSGR
jgi:hypothetical protein